ncbi:Glycosyltransferase involved in cell wall bisynthesis [Bryocella elongata]|uniref:Glycosyltransferase involved in cell wall bisynthesis n=1 Tax=Bryocella elongata TaxID=863522 RepID=A0A1H5TS56_9BACT|nr:glycosyltransferase family 4 protein [Bryocella elongata]SEF65712.1 Glycosyltransferase involved in cell wall bisynthesis [Bryocella elongata]
MPGADAPFDIRESPGPIDLFITEVEQFGGAERSLLALARWLHGHGRRVQVLCYVDRCGLGHYAEFPLPVKQLLPEGGSVVAKVRALRTYVRGLSKEGPRILASGYQPALHLTLAGARGFHCLMHDTPALFSDAGSGGVKAKLRTAISNTIIGRGMRRGGTMIVTSEFLRDDCLREFGAPAVIARMGGLGAPRGFQRRLAVHELRLLSVCRIEANKRIEWMLESLAELERGPEPLSASIDWRLDLAGRGALLQAMQARAQELGLDARVTFHGFVPDTELERMYDRAHAFLMPAVQGYGIPAIEALERGLPVLLHRESGVSDILLETPWAVVMRGGQEEMTPALRKLIHLTRSETVLNAPEPVLPSEDGWAEQVALLCGYVGQGYIL